MRMRQCMDKERLTGLALLKPYIDINIDMEKIIDRYEADKNRTIKWLLKKIILLSTPLYY